MPERSAGIFGNAVHDVYVEAQAVRRTHEGVEVTLDGSSMSFLVPPGVSKVTVDEVPRSFLQNVRKTKAGGGAVNSRIAAAMIAPRHEIRLLDANERDSFLESEIPSPVRWLGLRRVVQNFVFGDRDDKIIFRSRIQGTGSVTALRLNDVDWLCEGQAVLFNSPKDKEPLTAAFDQRTMRVSMLFPS